MIASEFASGQAYVAVGTKAVRSAVAMEIVRTITKRLKSERFPD